MKYKFVNKAKNLTPDDIKAQMNFDNVVKGASIWAGFKLGSVILKLGSKVTASVVAGTSTVVVATAVVVGTTTDLLKVNNTQEASESTEISIPLEEEPQLEVKESKPLLTPVKEEEKKEEVKKDTPKKPQVKKVPKIVPKPLPQKALSSEKIASEDIVIDASPLPNVETFLNFIDGELKYPIDPIEVNNDSLQQVEGFVEVFFRINREGKAEDFRIRKSLGTEFDNEAIRVLKMYDNWAPASFNGEAVESNLRFKVHFKVK